MVIAHHLIWTMYGWWLPNDPRGSMSSAIHRDVLKELGDIHYGRKRVQPASRAIREFYDLAAPKLTFPLITLRPDDFQSVARSFFDVVKNMNYTCYACAIMPDHIHIVIRKHRDSAETMIGHLQDSSRDGLRSSNGIHRHHPIWGGCGWKVFLDSPEDVRRTIDYVEENPIKARLPKQAWDFVVPYDNWPFHRKGADHVKRPR